MYSFGDSFVKGEAVAFPFPVQIAKAKNLPITNYGLNGSQITDVADYAYTQNISPSDISILSVGVNDARTGLGNQVKLSWFGLIYKAITAFLAIPNTSKIFANNSTVVCSGPWIDGLWGFGKFTNGIGAKASFQIEGSTLYIGLVASDTWGGTFSITVDGIVKEVGTCAGDGKIKTVLGRVWTPFLIRIPNLTPGVHTVEITNTSSGGANNYIGFDWAASPCTAASVFSSEISKLTQSGYNMYGGSDIQVDCYNRIIGQVIGELYSDGLSTYLVASPINQNTDLADSLHPTQTGYQKIANAFLSEMKNFNI